MDPGALPVPAPVDVLVEHLPAEGLAELENQFLPRTLGVRRRKRRSVLGNGRMDASHGVLGGLRLACRRVGRRSLERDRAGRRAHEHVWCVPPDVDGDVAFSEPCEQGELPNTRREPATLEVLDEFAFSGPGYSANTRSIKVRAAWYPSASRRFRNSSEVLASSSASSNSPMAMSTRQRPVLPASLGRSHTVRRWLGRDHRKAEVGAPAPLGRASWFRAVTSLLLFARLRCGRL